MTSVDLSPWARAAGETAPPTRQPIRWVTADIFDYRPPEPPDLVLSSLFAHHLDDDGVVRFLRWMEANAALGWFVNDLQRHWLPYRAFRAWSRLAGWHRFVQHDGPVSIGRGFSRADWRRLLFRAGLGSEAAHVQWWAAVPPVRHPFPAAPRVTAAADLAVIGGGLAGGALALRAAGRGRRVVLIERERGARTTRCAASSCRARRCCTSKRLASTQPRSAGCRSGACACRPADAPPPRRCRSRAWACPAACWTTPCSPVPRTPAPPCCTAGAPARSIPTGTATRIRLEDGTLLDAAEAALATGKHDLRGWRRAPGRQNDLVGFKLHLRLDPEQRRAVDGHVELTLFRGGYAGLQLVSDAHATLCLLVRRRRLAALGGTWDALSRADRRRRPAAAPPPRRVRAAVAPAPADDRRHSLWPGRRGRRRGMAPRRPGRGDPPPSPATACRSPCTAPPCATGCSLPAPGRRHWRWRCAATWPGR